MYAIRSYYVHLNNRIVNSSSIWAAQPEVKLRLRTFSPEDLHRAPGTVDPAVISSYNFV